MSQNVIANNWTPEIWMPALTERMATFPSLLNSGVAVRDAEFDAKASGAGIAVHIPFWKDITDQADEVQVEDTAPVTTNGITTGEQVAPILRRVTKNAGTALAGVVATGNPAAAITAMVNQVVERRLKQRQTVLLSILRGAFNSYDGASGAAAPLSANRIDNFDEAGDDATSDQIFNPDMFINGTALLGELADDLQNGALWVHPNVYASLQKADKESFKEGVESGLPFRINTYRGIPIFRSASLYRAGTTNGSVYETYILSKGIVARGEKPQVMGTIAEPVIGDATFNYNPDVDKNNQQVFDRTTFLMHLNGMKWTGTPASNSASNSELYTRTNWSLVYSSAPRTGAVCIRTNG